MRARFGIVLALAAGTAWAGGGSETTVLVVNARSVNSLRVANVYARLRKIPQSRVLHLPNVPAAGVISLEDYNRRIARPLARLLKEAGLEERTDLVAYSTDFPYAIRIGRLLRNLQLPKATTAYASLTGLTYFARHVQAGDGRFAGPRANRYFGRWRSEGRRFHLRPPVAFDARTAWDERGLPLETAAEGERHRYRLSAVLGHAGRHGNSVPEILAYLRRSVAADGTRPKGTVYFVKNKNVRSTVRDPLFPLAVQILRNMGRNAAVLEGREQTHQSFLPKNRKDVIGVVVGSGRFDWAGSGSTLLPGALADHLTSYGAAFHQGQTKVSEFLRHGAAGASGTVEEPYAVPYKFPSPFLHVFYAAGCSMAEAYYQSVSGPYQLLIVGDPLARPYARFGDVRIGEPELTWKGKRRPSGVWAPFPAHRSARLEVWLNGRFHAQEEGSRAPVVDTTVVDDGVHELRLVAVDAGPIGTRTVGTARIRVSNHGRAVTAAPVEATVPYGERLVLKGTAPGASSAQLFSGERLLAETRVEEGEFSLAVDTRRLGPGPGEVWVRGIWPDGGGARSAPLGCDVLDPAPLPAVTWTGKTAEGLVGEVRGGGKGPRPVVVRSLEERRGLAQALGIASGLEASLSGEFACTKTGLYQLRFLGTGKLTVEIDGTRYLEKTWIRDGAYLALSLAKGWHRIRLELTQSKGLHLRAQASGPVVGAALVTRHRVE